MLICSASIRENHMFSMGDKNKMEPNPFSFKCLEFTLFSEWYCQRTYLRGCCNKSIQQRRGRDAEGRSCSALCKPCPGKMTSCPACSVRHPHLLDNSHKMAQALSFSIQELLQLGWVLPINAPQLPPSSLLASWWCPACWWCPAKEHQDGAVTSSPGSEPKPTWFPAHLPEHKAHIQAADAGPALGAGPRPYGLLCFLCCSHITCDSHLSINQGKPRSSFPLVWMLEIN